MPTLIKPLAEANAGGGKPDRGAGIQRERGIDSTPQRLREPGAHQLAHSTAGLCDHARRRQYRPACRHRAGGRPQLQT